MKSEMDIYALAGKTIDGFFYLKNGDIIVSGTEYCAKLGATINTCQWIEIATSDFAMGKVYDSSRWVPMRLKLEIVTTEEIEYLIKVLEL